MRKTTAALIAALPLSGLAGCGGDSSRLPDALNAVSSGPAGQRYFAWSDQAAIQKAGGDLPSGAFSTASAARWKTPLTVGVQPLALEGERDLDETVGLDVLDNDQATLLGLQGREGFAVHLDGANPGSYGSAVAKGDFEQVPVGEGEHTAYELPDGDDLEVRPVEGVRYVLVGADTVAAATDMRALEDVLGEGEAPLGDREGYAAAADCLGDVVSATISPAAGLGLANLALVATGTRAGDTPVDVLCAVGAEQQVAAAADALRAELEGDDAGRFERVEVEVGEGDDVHFARAVVTRTDDQPLGFMTQALSQGIVRRWLSG